MPDISNGEWYTEKFAISLRLTTFDRLLLHNNEYFILIIDKNERISFAFLRDLRCLRNTIHANLFSTYILTSMLWLVPLALGVSQYCIHIYSFAAVVVVVFHWSRYQRCAACLRNSFR